MPRAQPGQRFGGRVKGTPNKVTSAAKALAAACFDDIGGAKAFAVWAKENRTAFYKLWARQIPHEVSGEDGGPVEIIVRHS